MKLRDYQQSFIDDNKDKDFLAFETGTGKTLCALMWMSKRPNYDHLIVVPKNIKGKWAKDVKEYKNITCNIVTKEEFKKMSKEDLAIHGSIVVDEADYFGSPLFMKGRSQLAEHLYNFIKDNDPSILLLTATPFRSSPHTIHSLLTYIGEAPPWKDWQRGCYELKYPPYLPTPAWMPKKNWRKIALTYALPRMRVAKLSDIAEVPTQHEEEVSIPTPKLDPLSIVADNATAEWHEYARAENGKEKLDWIKEYIRGRSKVVIVCRYKSQIEMYAKELSKITEVFVLTGETKKPDEEIEQAKEAFECVFLVQASIGAGFQLAEDKTKPGNEKYYNFSHMIFASLSFSHRDYIQMKGRILRGDSLQENWYTHLIGGAKDRSVYDRIMKAEDFNI